MTDHAWVQTTSIGRSKYQCGYCGAVVAPDRGYTADSGRGASGYILICPHCTKPTYFDDDDRQHPAVRLGRDVGGITDKGVSALYEEARDSTSLGAYTGAVLCCRKLLMNIAVQHGAEEGLQFIKYIDFLESSGFIPPNGKTWVDQIRKKGNEATHEIKVMSEQDAQQLMHFVEMLLRFIYEFPSMVQPNP